MRLAITCKLKEEVLPIDYRRKIVSLIKSCISEYDENIFSEMYEGNNSKGFSFSVYLKGAKITKEKAFVGEKAFVLNITTGSVEEGIHFYNSFLKAQSKKNWISIGSDNQVQVDQIFMVKEKPIIGNSIVFALKSPLVIREHAREGNRDWFYTFEDEGFETVLKKNLKFQLKNQFEHDVRPDIEALEFIPETFKKTVVKSYNAQIPVSLGTFTIKGAPYLLDYFYKNGLGSRRNSGFGYLEIV